MGDDFMRIQNEVDLDGDKQGDDEGRRINVADMIGHLRSIERSIADDPCLMDLAPDIIAMRIELEERRKLAEQIAAEIDAKNCTMPN